MRKSSFWILALVLMGLALVWMFGAEHVLAAPNDPPARWESTLVDSGLGTGQYASLAIHPTTGLPWISYWYSPTNELHLAQYVRTGGNCGNGAWSCGAVATGILPPTTPITGGMYSSLAFTPEGQPAIAFYGGALGFTIRYAERFCNPLCHWSVKDIYSGSLFGGRGDLSLQIGSDGIPRIAAYIPGSGGLLKTQGKLMYFHRLSDNSGSGCISGTTDWQCDTIETRSTYERGDGVYASLALVKIILPYPFGSYIEPHIAYYDADAGVLKHAYNPFIATNRNCGPSDNTWVCETVETGANKGLYPVMATDQTQSGDRRWQIAYYDANAKALKFAYNVSSGGNCGTGDAAGKWQCDTIEGASNGEENIGDMDGDRVFSVATYKGTTAIAYYDNNDATLFHNGILKWARSGYGPLDGGNCGPIRMIGTPPYALLYKTWFCESLDGGVYFSGGYIVPRDVGQYPALAYNSAGLAKIAYYDVKSGLRYQEQRLPVFLPLTLKNQ